MNIKKDLVLLLGLPIIFLSFTVGINAQTFSSTAEQFSVWFPTKPTIENSTVENIPVRQYSTNDGKILHSVAVTLLPKKINTEAELSRLYDTIRDKQLAGFNGKLLIDTDIRLAGYLGRSYSLSANSEIGLLLLSARDFVYDGRLYEVMTFSPGKGPQSPTIKKFFDSFKFTGAAAAGAATPPASSADVSVLMTQGTELYKARNYTEAIRVISSVIKLNPNLELSYFYRGAAYYDTKQYALAVADYTKAIELSKQTSVLVENVYNRCLGYSKLGNPTLALADCTRAATLDPTYFLAYFQRGTIYYNSGKTALALKDYSKTIELRPKYALAYTYRADCYDILGNKKLADQDRATAKTLEK